MEPLGTEAFLPKWDWKLAAGRRDEAADRLEELKAKAASAFGALGGRRSGR